MKGLRFPLFDGQVGVLPGRAPLVGRLGTGALKFDTTDGTTETYFVEGGFVQIKGAVVTLLTNRGTTSWGLPNRCRSPSSSSSTEEPE